MPAIDATHGPAIAPSRSGKGTLRFPLDQPLPLALVRKVVRTRVDECRAAARSSSKAARQSARRATKPRTKSR